MKLFKTPRTSKPVKLRELSIHSGVAPSKPPMEFLPRNTDNAEERNYLSQNTSVDYLGASSLGGTTEVNQRHITGAMGETNEFYGSLPGMFPIMGSEYVFVYASSSRVPTVYKTVAGDAVTPFAIMPDPVFQFDPVADATANAKTTEATGNFSRLAIHVTADHGKLILVSSTATVADTWMVEYTFGTPGDFSTLVFERDLITANNVTAERLGIDDRFMYYSIAFYPDDSGFYYQGVTSGGTGRITHAKTSIPGDFAYANLTVSMHANTFDEISAPFTSVYPYLFGYSEGFWVAEDGRQLIMRNRSTEIFRLFDLSTPYDVTTMVHVGALGDYGFNASYDGFYHTDLTDSAYYAIDNAQVATRVIRWAVANTRLRQDNLLVTFNPDIDLATSTYLAHQDAAEGVELVWGGGPLSALVPAGGGVATYFMALFEDALGYTIPAVGTVGITGSGSDMEFSTTTFAENDVVELNTLKFAFNGVVA